MMSAHYHPFPLACMALRVLWVNNNPKNANQPSRAALKACIPTMYVSQKEKWLMLMSNVRKKATIKKDTQVTSIQQIATQMIMFGIIKRVVHTYYCTHLKASRMSMLSTS